jgi:hypothetical protein
VIPYLNQSNGDKSNWKGETGLLDVKDDVENVMIFKQQSERNKCSV